MIFFLDVYKEEDKLILHDEWNDYLTIRDIWINFTGYKCPNLRNKPKIFIFQVIVTSVYIIFDDIRLFVGDKVYIKYPA